MAVYMMQAKRTGPVKIGTARCARTRLSCLQSANKSLRIIRLFEGGREEEASLHARFATSRLKGEWFKFEAAMLEEDFGLQPIPLSAMSHVPSHPLNMTLDKETWEALDEWRAAQPGVPTRLNAVRRIIANKLLRQEVEPT